MIFIPFLFKFTGAEAGGKKNTFLPYIGYFDPIVFALSFSVCQRDSRPLYRYCVFKLCENLPSP